MIRLTKKVSVLLGGGFMLTLTIIAGMVITLVFFVLADEKSLMRFPLLHKSSTIINPMIKAAYHSDIVAKTIHHIKALKNLAIGTICGLTKKGGM